MLRQALLLCLIAVLLSACNLDQAVETTQTVDLTPEALPEETPEATQIAMQPTREQTKPPNLVQPAAPRGLVVVEKATETPEALPTNTIAPTLTPTLTPSPTIPPTTQVPQCEVLRTYVGSNPNSFLSMRERPNTRAPQVTRLPNDTDVLLVAGSLEVAADSYNWLHVIYIDADNDRYQGWTARDSFVVNGGRDPSVATLRPTGRTAPC